MTRRAYVPRLDDKPLDSMRDHGLDTRAQCVCGYSILACAGIGRHHERMGART